MKTETKKKIIIGLAVLLCLGGIVLFDYFRSKMFHLEVLEMNPNPAVADGQTPVEVEVLLTDNGGNPVEGHTIFALPKTGGMFHSQREVTDEEGKVFFIYYPYKASGVVELKDGILSFSDESNSVFIEINTKTEATLELLMPEEEKIDSDILDGIFGE